MRPGQNARVHIDALPSRALDGTVAAISPVAVQADFRNRDVKVYPVSVRLPEVDAPLKPGMTAEVQIFIAAAKNALRVPINSIIRSGRKTVCAVETSAGFAVHWRMQRGAGGTGAELDAGHFVLFSWNSSAAIAFR